MVRVNSEGLKNKQIKVETSAEKGTDIDRQHKLHVIEYSVK